MFPLNVQHKSSKKGTVFSDQDFFADFDPDKYSLLVTDFRMDKMNGSELGIKVKEINNDIDVILVTAYENIEDNPSNVEVLSKPLTIQILLHKVNKYLKR
jgi:DNA-binding NtrC family response regulator